MAAEIFIFYVWSIYLNLYGGWVGGWVGGRVGGWFNPIIMPLCGPSCKLRLSRFSAKLKFQDGPSVAIMPLIVPSMFACKRFLLGPIILPLARLDAP